MKYILTLILAAIIFTNCNIGSSHENDMNREFVPNPEKSAHDGYSALPDSLKPTFKPDTTIGEISLLNSRNIEKYFGENTMNNLSDDGLPNSSVFSSDKKQQLTCYFHPGSVKNEFSEFKINYSDNTNRNNIVTAEKEFKTESRIKLGITIGDLKSIKGEPKNISSNNAKTTLHYRMDDFNNSNFLKKYNMPVYYADYKFRNGYLVEFRFGFEYP